MSRFSLTELTGGRGPFVAGTAFDLGAVGYEQAEYALTGTASAYGRTDAGVAVVEEAEVATRILVYRPTDAAAFDGTVIVEWLNVSGGLDAAPLWLFAHRELVRRGAAWIGVSAQQVGVQGGTSALSIIQSSLHDVDPERYGALQIPGDRFSYDIFTAAGEVARTGAGTILEGLPISCVLGIGESQSAFRLTTLVNDIDPVAPVYDGFLVHARGGSSAPLDDGDPSAILSGEPVRFRSDPRVPILCVEAETDLIALGYQAARQDDHDRLVVWEMAGTSHADVYTFVAGFGDDGLQPIEALAAGWRPTKDLFGMELGLPLNTGPQHYVVQAAVRSLEQWVRDGVRPPASPDLELDGLGFALDEHGNARGGIRTPHVEAPVATLSGLGNSGPPLAFLAGTTVPFTQERLVELYGTKEAFVERFTAAAKATVADGFLLDDDLDEIVAIAALNVDLT